MRLILAYLAVILLWSTTPLAIKWSGEGPGFLFGVTARMVIGAVCVFFAVAGSRRRLAWHSKARQTYLAVALQIYGSMTAVYWGAQFIPSGWISVLYGLSPLMTALLAAICLGERSLTPGKLVSYVMGVGGLVVMFGSALTLGRGAVLGMTAVIAAALMHSFSAVWIKSIDAKVPALNQVAGGISIALPAYLLTWGVADGRWPGVLSTESLVSILYLGIIATTIGFVLYYYLLVHLAATRVALITLISPVLALLLGNIVNQEQLTMRVLSGTLLILLALFNHEYLDRLIGLKQSVEMKNVRRR